ncbi:hypothetical protein SADUNF_Sadunf08G0059800 [Salix dunnii]|uniref:Ataxin-2 C-terminal domain-containing protein n=1 Tax=Salix dunnii TaxID=1413687 RepID=A0A835JT11_9ROSI|nr:hypothetical protein SADUNF_Sadunf08G0059800 [Salix dunnii]
MEIMSHRPASILDPNAPLFVPFSYRTVEDFSDQWWTLVQSSPCFRDYWLRECFHDPESDPPFSDFYDSDLPDDLQSLFFDDLIFDTIKGKCVPPSLKYKNFLGISLESPSLPANSFLSLFVAGEAEEEEEKVKGCNKELVSLGVMKWKNGRVDRAQAPRYLEKAPKIVNVKLSPRTIQQPK